MDKTEKHLQAHVNFDDMPDLFEALADMVEDDMTDRSKFIKRLIRQEAIRRRELAKAARKATRGRNVAATLQNQGG